jgi:hypothetical protein
MREIDQQEIESVAIAGGNVYYDIGHAVGDAYWAARDYMSYVVFPALLD